MLNLIAITEVRRDCTGAIEAATRQSRETSDLDTMIVNQGIHLMLTVRVRKFGICLTAWLVLGLSIRADDLFPTGEATIRGSADGFEIVIRTTARLAGAIDSLTWNGKEFIDSFDHGRQLQSASNFDAGGPLTAETFNPTEAGSRKDGKGASSTSRLLHMVTGPGQLQSTTQMAFWLAPDESSEGSPAKNTNLLSNHLLTKRVQIGYRHLPQVIQYEVTFSLPINEVHRHAVFEAVTGYMPAEFDKFLKYDAARDTFEALDDGPGEQSCPVILSTRSESHAMGVYSPEQPSRGFEHVGYGRFRFVGDRVVKWNCVFRVEDPSGIKPGDFTFRNFVIVGDLDTVKQSMRQLHQEFYHRTP